MKHQFLSVSVVSSARPIKADRLREIAVKRNLFKVYLKSRPLKIRKILGENSIKPMNAIAMLKRCQNKFLYSVSLPYLMKNRNKFPNSVQTVFASMLIYATHFCDKHGFIR